MTEAPVEADIVISTMRCSTPAYTKTTCFQFQVRRQLDFSATIHHRGWISIRFARNEALIQVARNIDYLNTKLMQKGNKLSIRLWNRYMEASTNKNEAKFRAFIYGYMENLLNLGRVPHLHQNSKPRHSLERLQHGSVNRTVHPTSELTNYVNNTNRGLNSNLLAEVSQDVETSIRRLQPSLNWRKKCRFVLEPAHPTSHVWQARTAASALNEAGIETEIVQFKSMYDLKFGGNWSATAGQFIHLIDQKLNRGLSILPFIPARMSPPHRMTPSQT